MFKTDYSTNLSKTNREILFKYVRFECFVCIVRVVESEGVFWCTELEFILIFFLRGIQLELKFYKIAIFGTTIMVFVYIIDLIWNLIIVFFYLSFFFFSF